ncbi:MBL fold metallo-hydrolase [Botrimarina hoheduenensis]|uniref:Ribonuclease BN n=1 Tax=Botrimarina hoheduenensis TaxID=2528000 RepID=A0A5C5W740_9BACT|nr:MBL fold metallo-hydrolase [Botrimarina hoheduenensis]TWT46424.1 Ribonuclease BN [Botrimarina hoheduenensis]
MRIELLGSGGFHPNERRHTLCVLLPELGVMLDAGTAAFRVHDRIATSELDIFLTHAHIDHIVGLTALLGLAHAGAPVTVRVHAAAEVNAAVRESLFAAELFPVPVVHEFLDLNHAVMPLRNGATLRTFPLEHPGGSFGVRVDHAGKSLALVTDTTAPSPATLDAIRGVDLLLHEAYFEGTLAVLATTTGHCTAGQAATTARSAGVKRLVMVHRDPRAADDAAPLAEARALFPNAEYGVDRQTIDV